MYIGTSKQVNNLQDAKFWQKTAKSFSLNSDLTSPQESVSRLNNYYVRDFVVQGELKFRVD